MVSRVIGELKTRPCEARDEPGRHRCEIAVEAEEGINMSLYLYKPSKAVEAEKELICHYIYTNPSIAC